MLPVDQIFPVVLTARDAARLVQPILCGWQHEKLVVLHLDGGRRLLGLVEFEIGAEADIALPVRAIVGDALRFGSAAIVLAHNHPSGDAKPSVADVAATKRLALLMAELGVGLHDHLVTADGDISSFRLMGLL